MNDNNLFRKLAQGSTTGDASELASYMRNDAISKMLVKLMDYINANKGTVSLATFRLS